MSARRFSDDQARARRRLRASDDEIMEAFEKVLEADAATPAAIKQLIAKRRGWRQIAHGVPS